MIWLRAPPCRDRPVTCTDARVRRRRRRPVVSARGPRRARQAADRRPSHVRRGRPALRRHQRRALARPGPPLAPRRDRARSTRARASWSSTSPPAPVRRASPSPTAARTVVPCDFSLGMLQVGKQARPHLPFTAGDGTRLPFADDTFDAVTISFGLRNIVDPLAGLRELRRVTRPGGRLVVCEFSHPTWAPFRTVYIEYLMKALPADRPRRLVLAGRLRLPRRVDPGLARPAGPRRAGRGGRLAGARSGATSPAASSPCTAPPPERRRVDHAPLIVAHNAQVGAGTHRPDAAPGCATGACGVPALCSAPLSDSDSQSHNPVSDDVPAASRARATGREREAWSSTRRSWRWPSSRRCSRSAPWS